MSEPIQENNDSKIDDGIVVHDPKEAIEQAKESKENAPTLPPAEELAKQTNVEGVGTAEIQSSRERHQFVE